MEITIRHVLEVSPQLAELLGRLLGVAGGHGHDRPAPMPPAVPAETGGGDVGAREATSLDVSQVPPPLGAAAPAAVAEEAARGAWRTAERRAVLERMYPEGSRIPAIRAALAAIAGPPLPVKDYAIGHWARDIGLKRPGDDAEPWRTAERRAILEEAWPAGVDVDVIGARMRALPGGEVLDSRLSVWAAQLKLARPAEHMARLALARTERIRGTRWAKAPEGEGSAAAPKAAAPAGPGEAVAVSEAPPPPQPAPAAKPAAAPKPPPLPWPQNGKIYARFSDIRAWAGFFGLPYDGSNLDRVNKLRAAKGLLPLVQDDTVAPAVREAA